MSSDTRLTTQSELPLLLAAGTPPVSNVAPLPWPARNLEQWWTRSWPLLLFAGSSLSIFTLSLGAIWCERAEYATRPFETDQSPSGVNSQPIDRPRPDKLGWLGTVPSAYGVGVMASAVGFLVSSMILTAFLRDGIAAAKRAGTYRELWRQRLRSRPFAYFSLSFFNNGLFYFFRFRVEVMRDHGIRRGLYVTNIPGATAATIYIAIQPHAVSTSEILRGMVVTGRLRGQLADAARFVAGAAIVFYAHLGAKPNSPAELRAFVRCLESFAVAVANLGPLSPMRQLRREDPALLELPATSATRRRNSGEAHPRMLRVIPEPYWPMALGLLSLLGRLMYGVGAVRAAYALPIGPSPDDPSGSSNQTVTGNAGPIGSLASIDAGFVFLALGFVVDMVATALLGLGARRISTDPQFPACYRRKVAIKWKTLCAANVLSSVLVASHRLISENRHKESVPGLALTGLWLGAIGTGLQNYSLVNLFAWNQIAFGRPSWSHIEEILQGLRCLGEASWHMWVVSTALDDFDHIAIELLFLLGEMSFLIGWAIPSGIIAHAEMQRALQALAAATQVELVARPTFGAGGSDAAAGILLPSPTESPGATQGADAVSTTVDWRHGATNVTSRRSSRANLILPAVSDEKLAPRPLRRTSTELGGMWAKEHLEFAGRSEAPVGTASWSPVSAGLALRRPSCPSPAEVDGAVRAPGGRRGSEPMTAFRRNPMD